MSVAVDIVRYLRLLLLSVTPVRYWYPLMLSVTTVRCWYPLMLSVTYVRYCCPLLLSANDIRWCCPLLMSVTAVRYWYPMLLCDFNQKFLPYYRGLGQNYTMSHLSPVLPAVVTLQRDTQILRCEDSYPSSYGGGW